MIEIHSTAVVDATAEIGADCTIGPYCVIGPGVRLGAGCRLDHHVSLTGPAVVGPGNRFFPFAAIGHRTQDLKYAGEPTHLEIGEGNNFREFCTVNRATAPHGVTRIGNGGNFLAYSHVAHDCTVGDHVVFSNNGTLAGHVTVEDYAVLGGLTAVHQFCRIGRHSITGGCSKIVQDVPPFVIADGNPAVVRGINQVGLERHGFTPEDLRSLKEAYKIVFLRGLSLADALNALRSLPPSDPVSHLARFIEQSQRGVVRKGADDRGTAH